jgi:hypothetical protein
MTRDEFLIYLETTYKNCIEIVKKKNADYAKGDDPFRNFRFSQLIDIPVEDAIMVRILDKMARIGNLLHKPSAVLDEKIEDTIADSINYLAILKAFLKDRK